MSERDAESNFLAAWRYTPEEWRIFTENEREHHRFEVSDELTKHRNLIVIGGAIAVLMGLLAGGLPGLAIVLVLVVGFLVVVTFIHQVMRKTAQHGLEAMNGEVWIMPDGVCTNGMWFGWAARDPNWRLRIVRRETIFSNEGKGVEILEFKCIGTVTIRGQPMTVDKEWRVPIPAGKEAEADAIITRLMATQHLQPSENTNQDPLSLFHGSMNPEGVLGHEFAGDVCSKCGSTVEAITAFKWSCKQ
jgi:hypothetical protein